MPKINKINIEGITYDIGGAPTGGGSVDLPEKAVLYKRDIKAPEVISATPIPVEPVDPEAELPPFLTLPDANNRIYLNTSEPAKKTAQILNRAFDFGNTNTDRESGALQILGEYNIEYYEFETSLSCLKMPGANLGIAEVDTLTVLIYGSISSSMPSVLFVYPVTPDVKEFLQENLGISIEQEGWNLPKNIERDGYIEFMQPDRLASTMTSQAAETLKTIVSATPFKYSEATPSDTAQLLDLNYKEIYPKTKVSQILNDDGSQWFNPEDAGGASYKMRYGGAVDYYSDLPAAPEYGEVYTVRYTGEYDKNPSGVEYMWVKDGDANGWIPLGPDFNRPEETAPDTTNTYVWAASQGQPKWLKFNFAADPAAPTAQIPPCPTTPEGTFILKATVSPQGEVVYNWVAEAK